MDVSPTRLRQEYFDDIKVIEANIKDIASGIAPQELYEYAQKKLDKLAEHYQYNEQLGAAKYKLYELQALLYYYQDKDDDARAFIQQAIETKGASYSRAERLLEQLQSVPARSSNHSKPNHQNVSNHELPLELQSLIKSLRTSAIIMAVISVISVYFIPWAVFYLILATKLKPKKLPSRKLIKTAAIATLPLCLGVIPIIIDVEFWRGNRRLKEYEERGAEACISDKEFLAGDKKRKKSSKTAWVLLLSLITIFAVIIIVAVVSSNSSSSNTSGSSLNSGTVTPYVSVEHNFVVSFPGFPETERQTIQESGYNIPYTIYSADTDNGNKAYLVGVYDFTGIEIDETGALEGAVNGAVRNTEGATLIGSNFSTFSGLKSIEAHYAAPVGGRNYDGYMMGFIKNSKMYALLTIGEDKSAFDTFVNSFRFN